jgi:excisionase family DNA binding protein
MQEKFLTIEEAAKKLGLNYKTVFRYIHDKKIEATKIGRWRIREKELEEFIKRSSNLRNK